MPKTNEAKLAANRRYGQKITKNAKAGDLQAIEQNERNKRSRWKGRAKSFIKKEATRQEINEFRDLMAERIKLLNELKKDSKKH